MNYENLETPLSPSSSSAVLAIRSYSSEAKATSKSTFADVEILRSTSETQTSPNSSSAELEIPRYLSKTKENPNNSSADMVIPKYSSKTKANPGSSTPDLETPEYSIIAPVSPSSSKDYRTILSGSFEDSLRLMVSKRKQTALSRPKNDMTPSRITFKSLKTPGSSSEVPAKSRSSSADMAIQRYSVAPVSPTSSRVVNRNCLKAGSMSPRRLRKNPTPTKTVRSSFEKDSTTLSRSCADLVNQWFSMADPTTLNNSFGDSQSLNRSKVDPTVSRRARKDPTPAKITTEILNTPMISSVGLEIPCSSSGASVSLSNSKADPTTISRNSVGELVNLSFSDYSTTIPSRSFVESVNLSQVKADSMATRRSRKNPAPTKISSEILTFTPKLSTNNYRTISKVRTHLRKFSTVLMNIKEVVNIIVDLVSKYRQSVMKISDAINSACLSLNISPNASIVNSLATEQKENKGKMSSKVLRYFEPNIFLAITNARAEVDADFLGSKLLEKRVTGISTDINAYLNTAEMKAKEKFENQSLNDDIINADALPLTEVHMGLNIIHHEILHFRANRKFRSQSVATLTRDVLNFSRLFRT